MHSFDETFFEKIDSEEKAWVLGVLYADGSNSGQNLRLSMVDFDIIEKIKQLLKFTGEIKIVKPKSINYKISYRISICGKKIVEQMDKLGCVKNKSLTVNFPEENILPRNLYKHFIRGLLDGDGWVTSVNKGVTVGICGASPLMIQLPSKILTHIDVDIKNYPRTNLKSGNTTHNQCFKQIISVERFLHWIYDEAKYYGDRKKSKADLIFKRRENIENKKDNRKGLNRLCLR